MDILKSYLNRVFYFYDTEKNKASLISYDNNRIYKTDYSTYCECPVVRLIDILIDGQKDYAKRIYMNVSNKAGVYEFGAEQKVITELENSIKNVKNFSSLNNKIFQDKLSVLLFTYNDEVKSVIMDSIDKKKFNLILNYSALFGKSYDKTKSTLLKKFENYATGETLVESYQNLEKSLPFIESQI